MSMRMCSLASSVQGEHSKNTMLNSTHCNSSHEFDEVSKTLADGGIGSGDEYGGHISHAIRFPIQVVTRRLRALTAAMPSSNASRAPT